MGDPVVKFDPMKYMFLGDPSLPALPRVLWVRGDLPIRTLADLKNRKEPLAVGATGVGQSAAIMGEFERSLGLNVKVVVGYKGSTGILAALERKELEGMNLSPPFRSGPFQSLHRERYHPAVPGHRGQSRRRQHRRVVATLKGFGPYFGPAGSLPIS